MHLPFASAKWQSLWRMHRIRQSVVIQSVVLPNIVEPSGVMLNVIVSFAIFASAKCIRLWRMRCVCQFAEANWQMAKPPPQAPKANAKRLWLKFSFLSLSQFFSS